MQQTVAVEHAMPWSSACQHGPARLPAWVLRRRSVQAHNSAATSLALTPDGWGLLSGGRDGIVVLWDLRSHQQTAVIPVYEAVEGGTRPHLPAACWLQSCEGQCGMASIACMKGLGRIRPACNI